MKSSRRKSHDCERDILDEERCPENSRSSREAAGPIVVTDDRDRGVVFFIVGRKAAAEKDFRAEAGKEVSTDFVSLRFLGRVAVANGDLADTQRSVGDQISQDIMALA